MTATASVLRNAPDLADLDRRYLFHPFTALAAHEVNGPPLIIVKGKGVWLEDDKDNRYIDAMAGLWCVNAGYGRTEIADAIRQQALTLPYFHLFSGNSTDAPILLAERLIEMAPVPMSKVFFGNSGSDANDTQIKLVWYYNNARGKPQKKKIIARERGYHGVTIMSASLTGLPGLHSGFDLPLPFVRRTTAPRPFWEGHGLSDEAFVQRLAADLEALIVAEDPDTIGAMIMEPVMGAGGVIVPPKGYYPAIQAVLKKYDILTIADEVITGFGRLGTLFGTTVMEMQPDLITVAKGITSAYVPLSACFVSEHVWRTIVDGEKQFGAFGHGYTYTAHPIGAAAAMANLDLIERENLVEQAAERGALMQRLLRETFNGHPLVGEVRGQGLIAAVEFVEKREPPTGFAPSLGVGARVVKEARARGLITRALPNGDIIAFSPPFVISEDEIGEMVGRARAAVGAVADALVRDGVRIG
jgi:L-2,4-diaminobutyrate transaminase